MKNKTYSFQVKMLLRYKKLIRKYEIYAFIIISALTRSSAEKQANKTLLTGSKMLTRKQV